MKRGLSFFLALMLFGSVFVMQISSAETQQTEAVPLTRRAFVASLAAMHNITDDADVWAYSHGLIIGNEHGDLMLDNPITREQASLIVDRYLALCGIYGASTQGMPLYSDDSTISDWARVAVYHMTAYGFLPSGIGNNFVPQGILSSEQAAFCIERLLPFSKQFNRQ